MLPKNVLAYLEDLQIYNQSILKRRERLNTTEATAFQNCQSPMPVGFALDNIGHATRSGIGAEEHYESCGIGPK